MTDVVTLGEAMLLLLAEGATPLAAAARFERSVAGAEATVAVGLARLGHDVAYAGRVGDDPFGDAVRATLRAEGVDVAALRTDPDRPTGLLLRDAPAGRPVTVAYRRDGSAGSALGVDDVPALAGTRYVHVTGLTAMLSASAADAVDAVVRDARAAGAHVVWDPNVRRRLGGEEAWREVADRVLDDVGTALVGADELAWVTGTDDVDDAVARLHARGVGTVVVKDGARGALADDGHRRVHRPARPVPVVDPVGAGDAFAAGWLSARLDGLDLDAALDRATAVASCVVAARTDLDGLPRRRDLAVLTGHGDAVR